MTTVSRTHQILVTASARSAFDYVSDLTRHPEWSSGQLQIEEVHAGPIAIGKEYLSRGQVALQKERSNRVRITEYEPPQRFGFVAEDPDFGSVYHIFTFVEQGGQVLIRRVMTLTLNPLAALLFRFLLYPVVGRPAMDKSLALLKKRLEGR